ncbi:hypothetical protein HGRIS_003109 [Hohenbuehelia grisea]|uniref:Uncharacterized protein n=1 Tax=Hohenbuehelia grisea TaxID=104357 RepID=A0ABR3JNY2_9AGAR
MAVSPTRSERLLRNTLNNDSPDFLLPSRLPQNNATIVHPVSPLSPKQRALRSNLERALSSPQRPNPPLARRASHGSRRDVRTSPQITLLVRELEAEVEADGRWDAGVSDSGNEARDECGHGVRIAGVKRASASIASSPTDAACMRQQQRRHQQQQQQQLSSSQRQSASTQSQAPQMLTSQQQYLSTPLLPHTSGAPKSAAAAAPPPRSPTSSSSLHLQGRAPAYAPLSPRAGPSSSQVQAYTQPHPESQSQPQSPQHATAQNTRQTPTRHRSAPDACAYAGLGHGQAHTRRASASNSNTPARTASSSDVRARSKSTSTGARVRADGRADVGPQRANSSLAVTSVPPVAGAMFCTAGTSPTMTTPSSTSSVSSSASSRPVTPEDALHPDAQARHARSHSHSLSPSPMSTHARPHHAPSTSPFPSPTKPFNARRASAQCREMQGYVSFGDVEGLGGPPGEGEGDEGERGEGKDGERGRKGVLGWLGL